MACSSRYQAALWRDSRRLLLICRPTAACVQALALAVVAAARSPLAHSHRRRSSLAAGRSAAAGLGSGRLPQQRHRPWPSPRAAARWWLARLAGAAGSLSQDPSAGLAGERHGDGCGRRERGWRQLGPEPLARPPAARDRWLGPAAAVCWLRPTGRRPGGSGARSLQPAGGLHPRHAPHRQLQPGLVAALALAATRVRGALGTGSRGRRGHCRGLTDQTKRPAGAGPAGPMELWPGPGAAQAPLAGLGRPGLGAGFADALAAAQLDHHPRRHRARRDQLRRRRRRSRQPRSPQPDLVPPALEPTTGRLQPRCRPGWPGSAGLAAAGPLAPALA